MGWLSSLIWLAELATVGNMHAALFANVLTVLPLLTGVKNGAWLHIKQRQSLHSACG